MVKLLERSHTSLVDVQGLKREALKKRLKDRDFVLLSATSKWQSEVWEQAKNPKVRKAPEGWERLDRELFAAQKKGDSKAVATIRGQMLQHLRELTE